MLVAVLVVLATLVAGACAPDRRRGEGVARAPVTSSTSTVAPSPSAENPSSSTTTRGGAARTGPAPSTRPLVAPTTASPTPTAPPTASARSMVAPIQDGRTGPPGSYARALLRPTPATSIVVEVIAESGAQLRSGTMSYAERVLEGVTEKDVTLTATGAAADDRDDGDDGWNASSVVAFAERHGRVKATSEKAVIRLLALSGGFSPDEDALGVAVRGDVLAIFVDKVNAASTLLVDSKTIEEAVAVHELGHLLGLVDIAIDRNRDDPEHPFHSRNPGSVMYWAVETGLVGQILGGPPARTFDQDDEADLAALRAGA